MAERENMLIRENDVATAKAFYWIEQQLHTHTRNAIRFEPPLSVPKNAKKSNKAVQSAKQNENKKQNKKKFRVKKVAHQNAGACMCICVYMPIADHSRTAQWPASDIVVQLLFRRFAECHRTSNNSAYSVQVIILSIACVPRHTRCIGFFRVLKSAAQQNYFDNNISFIAIARVKHRAATNSTMPAPMCACVYAFSS